MPTDEPANRFVIYESKIRSSLRQGAPRTTYLHQISYHILPGEKTLEANEIRKLAMKKSTWSQLLVVSKKKSLRTDLLSRNDDDDDEESIEKFPFPLEMLFKILQYVRYI